MDYLKIINKGIDSWVNFFKSSLTFLNIKVAGATFSRRETPCTSGCLFMLPRVGTSRLVPSLSSHSVLLGWGVPNASGNIREVSDFREFFIWYFVLLHNNFVLFFLPFLDSLSNVIWIVNKVELKWVELMSVSESFSS